MLQTIREGIVGWALWILIGIIIVPFAFFGIESFRTGGGDPQLAKVGGQRITDSQLRAAYEQRIQQLQQLMGDKFNPSELDPNKFREAVLKDLIQESLLRQFVTDGGYRANDAAVFQALQAIPAFQDEGKFSVERYRARLSAMNYTPQRFETMLRESLVSDQLRDTLVLTAFQTPQAAEQNWKLAQQKRALSYALLSPERFRAQATVTEAQLQARYEERKSSYLSPERVRVEYLELALEDLAKTSTPSPEVLRAVYDTEKATRYTSAEERQTRHILIPFGADKDAARAQAEQLADKLKSGADFAALATASSGDPGSKAQGGSLGWVKRGQMTQKFEDALFKLDSGAVSAPVETEFGWHLIRLDALRASVVRPFEDAEVQRQLLETYRARETDKRFQELSEKLEQLAFESPGTLEPAAKALGLKPKTSDWLTRQPGEGLFANPKILEAAFSEDVVKNGENSRLLSAAPGRIVVLRKQAHEPARPRALAEVSDAIRDELRNEAARSAVQARSAAILTAVRKGGSLQSQAAEQGAEFRAPGEVTRSQQGIPAEILDGVFSLPRPKANASAYRTVEMANGGVAVVALAAVVDAPVPAADEAFKREQARGREQEAGAEFAAYRSYIESQYSVKITAPPAETSATETPAP